MIFLNQELEGCIVPYECLHCNDTALVSRYCKAEDLKTLWSYPLTPAYDPLRLPGLRSAGNLDCSPDLGIT